MRSLIKGKERVKGGWRRWLRTRLALICIATLLTSVIAGNIIYFMRVSFRSELEKVEHELQLERSEAALRGSKSSKLSSTNKEPIIGIPPDREMQPNTIPDIQDVVGKDDKETKGLDALDKDVKETKRLDSISSPFALVIICYNRPDYLQRTLDGVLKYFPSGLAPRPDMYISQDGHHAGVSTVIEKNAKIFQNKFDMEFHWLHHPQERRPRDDRSGYSRLARHFGWALQELFKKGYENVIVLEDDLEIAPDFFEYFAAMTEVLEFDDTLMAISAYNDLGQPQFVSDASAAYRSDFFPGLGWMLPSRVWDEIGSKWPDGYWDDWLREPDVRRGRAFIRPEVSRTRTFGEKGVSAAQFFRTYLSNIKLNDKQIQWTQMDLDYLIKDTYDQSFHALVQMASPLSLTELLIRTCDHDSARQLVYSTRFKPVHGKRIDPRSSLPSWTDVAKKFSFIPDLKAGVPRTAYQGIVRLSHQGCVKLLVPEDWDPEKYRPDA